MNKNLISIQEVYFKYQKQDILKNISLDIKEGTIFGLLGQNGAGKTTLIRLLLGLIRPTSGKISLFGKHLNPTNRISILKNVGSLIENASLYSKLSAYENLIILRKLYDLPISKIDHVLEITGLSEAKHEKVNKFSLGMKQRLGIALAIISDPKLLILDEPTNGLDPSGIIEFRKLIRRLTNETGVTVFISSHLLGEIERLADQVGILHLGELKYLSQFSSNELSETPFRIKVNESELNSAINILSQNNIESNISNSNEIKINLYPKVKSSEINRMLVAGGIEVFELRKDKQDLEQKFLKITHEL